VRLYIAGASLELLRLRAEAIKLTAAGHDITSRWLRTMTEGSQGTAPELSRQEVEAEARADLEDIAGSDAVVMYVPLDRADLRMHSGGRHVEVGFGIALGKKIVVVGKPENIFERCATTVPTTEAALNLVLR
jgi:nucleoside 2-deoxyribosyltransferase